MVGIFLLYLTSYSSGNFTTFLKARWDCPVLEEKRDEKGSHFLILTLCIFYKKPSLSNSLHPGEMAGEQTQAGKNTWRGTRYVGEPNLQR